LTVSSLPNYHVGEGVFESDARAAPYFAPGQVSEIMMLLNKPLYLLSASSSSSFPSAGPLQGPQVEALEPRRLLASTLKIMPLGDSITEAFSPHDSYRYWLWNALKSDGYKVDFVGSMHGVFDGPPKDTNFDQDHEGHVGWTADQILAHLSPWAKTYKPDIVLLHLGTNDMMLQQSVSRTVTELTKVVDTLRAANPKVSILFSKLIPNVENQAGIDKLNAQIPRLVKSLSTRT